MADEVKYDFKSVTAIRGMEARSKAKWQSEGWEFVDQSTSTVRTTLNFRRVKPPLPWPKIAAVAGLAVVLAVVIGIGALLEGGDNKGDPPQTASSREGPDKQQAKITDITVDELLDKLNSANMGGVRVGDRFRVVGELFESDLWLTGASGEYSVMLKAKGGADDLPVFVDEADADGWRDGTKVEFVVKMVEVTINGETTDGWLRAQSVKTLSGGTTKEAKKDDVQQNLSGALVRYAAQINKSVGITVIDSIERGSTDSVVNVNLNLGLASRPPLELRTTIKTMNGQIVDLAEESGPGAPIVKFYLAEDVVAENRYIVDPWDVKFKGLLDD